MADPNSGDGWNDKWGDNSSGGRNPSDQDATGLESSPLVVKPLPSVDLKSLSAAFGTQFVIPENAQGASFTKKAATKAFDIASGETERTEKPKHSSSRITQKGFKARPPREEKPGKEAKVWENKNANVEEQGPITVFDEADFGVLEIETIHGIEAYAAGTPWPCTILNLQTGEQLHGIDSDVRISFICDKHISHIQVIIAKSSKAFPEVADYRVVMRFSADAINKMTIAQVEHEDFQNLAPTFNRCYALLIAYELSELNCESLLVPNSAPQVQGLKDHIKANLPLVFHICGSEHTYANYAALHQQLAVDQSIHPMTKWICPGKSRFVIQKEEFIPKNQRPEHCVVAAKNSYFNYDELLVTQCIGDLQEQEYVLSQLSTYEKKLHDLYILELVKGGNRAFLGVLDVPVEDQIRLQAGDSLYIHDPAIEDDDDCKLHATVAEAIPGLPSTLIPLHVTNYYDMENDSFGHPSLTVKPIPLAAQDDLVKNLKALRASPKMRVKIVFDKNEQVYKDKVVGMALLNKWFSEGSALAVAFQQLIIGNNIEAVPTFNIFQPILPYVSNPKEVMHTLNEGQSRAIDHCMNAPAGAAIIQGPPGTGKTYVGTEISRPFVRAGLSDVHVLVASNANTPIDAFALRLHNMIMSENNPNAYLIRIFSFSTEKEIATRTAKLEARKAGIIPKHRPTLVEDLQPEEREAFECLRFSMVAYENYKREHTFEVELVPDDRVTEKCLKFAVGTRMLQVIGKIPAGKGDPTPQPQEFHEFVSLYQQVCNGTELTRDTRAKFKGELKRLMNHVIHNATIICTTASLAIQYKYASACSDVVKLVILEEAARTEQSEALSLRANYPQATGFVQIGDIQQLRTFVAASPEDGHFIAQLFRSLMYRWVSGGAPSAMLTVQHRMDRDIAGPPNELSYGGKLTNHESVNLEHRPFTRDVRAWNKERFGRERTAILIDIQGTTTSESPTKSRYNEVFVKYGINLAKDLVDRFPDKSVSIFVYYGAQYLLYLAAFDRLRLTDEKYDKIYIDKVDRIQGVECDFVITDMPVRGRGGFLNELNRLNVAHTRARYGFYYIIDKDAINKTKSNRIMRVVKSYMKSGLRHAITANDQAENPIKCPFFEENMVDFSSETATLPGGDGWDAPQDEPGPLTSKDEEEAALLEEEMKEIENAEDQVHDEKETKNAEDKIQNQGQEVDLNDWNTMPLSNPPWAW
ncbi:hypothetical protein AYO22_04495 [Fonsecaea multimorphosa]|nr:hypothetical protein AYO22_04495 [Fonsecaea multimorphosa]